MVEPRDGELTLAVAETGSRVKFVRVEGGHELAARLMSMGLLRGAEVAVNRNDSAGPVVLGMGHTRVAIGRGMAAKIVVAQVTACPSPGGTCAAGEGP